MNQFWNELSTAVATN